MQDYSADSEGVIFFNNRKGNTMAGQSSPIQSHEPLAAAYEQVNDNVSEASYMSVENRDVAVNTSHVTLAHPGDGVNNNAQDSALIGSMASILKDVVAELKILKEAIPQGTKQPSCRFSTGQAGDDRAQQMISNSRVNAAPRPRTYRPVNQHPTHYDDYISYNANRNSADWAYSPDEDVPPRRGDGRCGNVDWQYRRRDDRTSPGYHRSADSIKMPVFTGKEDWQVWLARFQTIARRHNWSEEDCLDNLLPRIEGQAAQFVYGQLPPEVLSNYADLIQEISSRFRVIETSRSFAAKFSRRIQRANETAEEYAADLKLLYDRAHGYRDKRTREEDLVRRFLDGLKDDEARFEVEYHKEPETIDQAVFHVVNFIQTKASGGDRRSMRGARRATETEDTAQKDEIESLFEHACRVPNKSSVDKTRVAVNKEVETKAENSQQEVLQKILERLQKLEEANNRTETKAEKARKNKNVECFNCHKMGHFARNCPEKAKPKPQGHKPNQTENQDVPLNEQGPALAAKGRSN